MVKKLSCKVLEENWRKKYTTIKSTKTPKKFSSKRATVKV
jgi:hypothetical protein